MQIASVYATKRNPGIFLALLQAVVSTLCALSTKTSCGISCELSFRSSSLPCFKGFSFVRKINISRQSGPKVIHRSKKDGDMSISPECIAGIK